MGKEEEIRRDGKIGKDEGKRKSIRKRRWGRGKERRERRTEGREDRSEEEDGMGRKRRTE